MFHLRNHLSLSNIKRPLLIVGGGLLFFLILYWAFYPSEKILDQFDFSQVVYDRHGQIMRISLSDDDKYRVYSHINLVSPILIDALLLKEDRYFFYHPGVNLASLGRAFFQTFVKGGKRIGGSTISMQLVRLIHGFETHSISGKIKQIILTLYYELYYNKNEILEAYINIAPCGGNIEGFAASAMICLDKHLIDLTLQEAWFLCVLPQNPSAYRPRSKSPEKSLLEAYERIASFWRAEHPEQVGDTSLFNMPLNYQYRVPFLAPHYTTRLMNKYSDEVAIYGTLDMKIQRSVERISERYIQRQRVLGVNNAAVMLVDANSMEILSTMGSIDFFNSEIEGQVNGTTSRRSPGSTLKPFIYALAMEQGLIHPGTMLKDAPLSFSEYSPDNYERDFKGPVKAWEALINSRNIPAVALAQKLNDPDLYDLIHGLNLGNLKPQDHYGLSIVLGSAELSMFELVELYGLLSNNGQYQHLVEAFEPDTEADSTIHSTLSEEVCFITRTILEQNPRPNSSKWSLPISNQLAVAYKTGTSIGFKDCWSIGMFDHYIIAVWLGNFSGYGNPSFNGRQMATPLMFEIIDSVSPDLVSEHTDEEAELPMGVIRQEICTLSGQLAHTHCKQKMMTLYIPGKSPIKSCDICREIYINVETGYRTFIQSGENIKKEVFEFWPTDLLYLFRQAGIPRVVPPPFDPKESIERMSAIGNPPQIQSPLEGTEYLITLGETWFNSLPLRVTTDADVKEVYWFVDDIYIGKSDPQNTQHWSLKPGVFQVSAIDDHGRGDTRKIRISLAR